jgi:hypothetical protein
MLPQMIKRLMPCLPCLTSEEKGAVITLGKHSFCPTLHPKFCSLIGAYRNMIIIIYKPMFLQRGVACPIDRNQKGMMPKGGQFFWMVLGSPPKSGRSHNLWMLVLVLKLPLIWSTNFCTWKSSIIPLLNWFLSLPFFFCQNLQLGQY